MRKRLRWSWLPVLAVGAVFSAVAQPTAPLQNRAPLPAQPYLELPLGAVRPTGWLRQQLVVMKEGATGHLDEYYPKLRDDNGWLGGTGDGWEETPYWLDGALPTAYLLDDKVLKKKVLQYINWNLDHQRPNGYFGPLTKTERQGQPLTRCDQGEDWWPRMVMLKVLKQYYTATQDPRVLPFMTKYFHYQLNSLAQCPLGKWSEWSEARGGDNLLTIYWLYNHTGDAALLRLGQLLYAQTMPWTQLFAGRNWVMDAAANQTGQHWMARHGVNVAMGLKLPLMRYLATATPADLQALKTGWNDIMTLHGLPAGMFSADEDLHGNAPTQGTELCAIVEAMYSLEQAVGISGDVQYMDALERMTYNALPTQTTDDYICRQYFQVANQVQVQRGVSDFSLPFDRGMNNVYGPYAGYTCCTVNMNQGWPKFTAHLWYATPDHGLAALELAPNTVTTTVANGQPVTIREETAYPFGEQVQFTVETRRKVGFPLAVRVPGWCAQATIALNGKPLRTEKGGQVVTISREWQNHDQLTLTLPMPVTTSNWAKNSRVVERGPLVYALKIDEKTVEGTQQQEGRYLEMFPQTVWNVGLPKATIDAPAQAIAVTVHPVAPASQGFFWNAKNAPIELKTKAYRLPNWQLVAGVAYQPVTARDDVYKGPVDPAPVEVTLIPYGCSKLRVVAFPVVPTPKAQAAVGP